MRGIIVLELLLRMIRLYSVPHIDHQYIFPDSELKVRTGVKNPRTIGYIQDTARICHVRVPFEDLIYLFFKFLFLFY